MSILASPEPETVVYRYNRSNRASIVSCSGSSSANIKLKPYSGGYIVDTIESGAFVEADINSVYIPASITNIADDAFDSSSDIIIRCSKFSTAYMYAIAHGLNYELTVSESNSPVYFNDISPTNSDRYTGNLGDSYMSPYNIKDTIIGGDGRKYSNGLIAWVARWNFGDKKSWVWNEYDISNYNYGYLSGYIDILSNTNNTDNYNTTLQIIGDDSVLGEYILTSETKYPVRIDIDIYNVDKLKIYVFDNEETAGGTHFILGDLALSYERIDPDDQTSGDLDDQLRYYNGHTYLVLNDSMTWAQADEYCELIGGHLATITSQEENDFIKYLTLNAGKAIYWLGGMEDQSTGEWFWITGEKWDYTNWNVREPTGGQYYLTFLSDSANLIASWALYGCWLDNPNAGTSGWTLERTGLICEWDYLLDYVPEIEFNEYIYRANISLENSDHPNLEAYKNAQKYLRGTTDNDTPSEKMDNATVESGYGTLAKAWTATTTLFDILVEGPGGALQKVTINQADVYTAILLESFESSFKLNVTEAINENTEMIRDVTDIFLDSCGTLFNAVESEYMDLLQGSSETTRNKVLSPIVDACTTVENAQTFMTFLDTTLDAVESYETWVENAIGYLTVLNMTNEMKYVIVELADNCPNSNTYLKQALLNCARIIEAGAEGFTDKILDMGYVSAGRFAVSHLVDAMWNICLDSVALAFPAVNVIIIAYKAGTFLVESLTNIDKTNEAYYKILNLLEYKYLAHFTFIELTNKYIVNKTETNAKIYLEAANLVFQICKLDAQYANEYVNELDKSFSGWLAQVFSGVDADELKEDFNSYLSIINDNEMKFNTFWCVMLERDYPELFDYYMTNRFAAEWNLYFETTIACPVNVYVYNSKNDLVGYVENGMPYASENISIIVEGDTKHIYFYDDDEYTIVSEGYDDGDMNIFTTYYDDEMVKHSYKDLAVSSGISYTLHTSRDESILINDGNVISPTYDSEDENETAYNVIIHNGFSKMNNTYESVIKACEGEIIELSAYIPENQSFYGWSCDNDDVIFNDAMSINTSFVMVGSDIVINALTSADAPTVELDANGGTLELNNNYLMTDDNGKLSVIPTPTRENYIFEGWYTERDNGTRVTTENIFTSDTTIYAHWKESTSDNEHSISNVWSTDADSHWHTCSCGERHDLSAHTATDWIIDKPATADSVGQMHKQCSVCGYLLESSEIPVVEEDDDLDWSWILLDLMRREYTITANANEGGTITNEGELTVKFDSSATYEIVPDEGYYIDTVIVDGDDIGAVSTYTFDGISSDHTIEAVFAKIEWENPYNDVSKDDWFYDAVKYVTENGLMNGMGSGMFMPYATSARAMIVTILWRLEGMPGAENAIEFSDVHNSDWYYDAVMWASKNKIVEGYGDTTFRPDTPITHEQLAAILYRYAIYKGYNTTAREVLTDNIIISDWATDAVEWANAVKLLDLFQLKEYLPREVVARCQMAYILMQFCALYVE